MNHYFDEDLLLSLNLQLLQTDVNTMLDSEKDLQEVLNEILKWIGYESKNDILTSILLYNKETNQLFSGQHLRFRTVIIKRSMVRKPVRLPGPVVQLLTLANR
jgi:hypothetical protein